MLGVLSVKIMISPDGSESSHRAIEYGADLIVMGSEGRKGVSRFLLGRVAEGVLRNAPCSVQIVRRKLT